jgi:hypothetical protein
MLKCDSWVYEKFYSNKKHIGGSSSDPLVIIMMPPGLPYSCELRPAPRQGIALRLPQGAALSLSGSR